MLTATFRRLGGAARLPFLDFLIFNLAFGFAFDFAFFGMAGHVQSGLSISVQRHAWPGRARPLRVARIGISRAPLRQAS